MQCHVRGAELSLCPQIVKERQMEFDIETDPDTMYDLFGEDYVCFAEYVTLAFPPSLASRDRLTRGAYCK